MAQRSCASALVRTLRHLASWPGISAPPCCSFYTMSVPKVPSSRWEEEREEPWKEIVMAKEEFCSEQGLSKVRNTLHSSPLVQLATDFSLRARWWCVVFLSLETGACLLTGAKSQHHAARHFMLRQTASQHFFWLTKFRLEFVLEFFQYAPFVLEFFPYECFSPSQIPAFSSLPPPPPTPPPSPPPSPSRTTTTTTQSPACCTFFTP